jgi:hypothetical protein
LEHCIPNFFFLENPLCPQKITTDPHILVHVNFGCPDDRFPKLKISDKYQYIQVPYRDADKSLARPGMKEATSMTISS